MRPFWWAGPKKDLCGTGNLSITASSSEHRAWEEVDICDYMPLRILTSRSRLMNTQPLAELFWCEL